jgi:hypothetical protein
MMHQLMPVARRSEFSSLKKQGDRREIPALIKRLLKYATAAVLYSADQFLSILKTSPGSLSPPRESEASS